MRTKVAGRTTESQTTHLPSPDFLGFLGFFYDDDDEGECCCFLFPSLSLSLFFWNLRGETLSKRTVLADAADSCFVLEWNGGEREEEEGGGREVSRGSRLNNGERAAVD